MGWMACPDRGSENGRTDDGTNVRFEEVCAHTSDVADVVTNVVSDCGGVAGIVFRNPGFNFTDKIGTDVSRFRVDTATDAREERNRRSAEAEARQYA